MELGQVFRCVVGDEARTRSASGCVYINIYMNIPTLYIYLAMMYICGSVFLARKLEKINAFGRISLAYSVQIYTLLEGEKFTGSHHILPRSDTPSHCTEWPRDEVGAAEVLKPMLGEAQLKEKRCFRSPHTLTMDSHSRLARLRIVAHRL